MHNKSKDKSTDLALPASYAALDTPLYGFHLALQHSYILDSGTTQHVCNDRTRFLSFQLVNNDSILITGSSTVAIKGIGSIQITVQCDIGQRKLTLDNVAYIPSFTTNLVCYNKFHDKGVF